MSNVLDVIKARTSVRCFEDVPVKEEDVRKIAEAAIWAPNAMNSQGWHFSSVTNRELIDEMSEATKAGMKNAPVPFLQERGNDPEFHAFFHAPLAVVITRKDDKFTFFDCGCAAQNICLAAKELGYDSCITASTEFMFAGDPALKAKLQIPEDYLFACAIPIGVKKDAPDDHVRDRKEDVISWL